MSRIAISVLVLCATLTSCLSGCATRRAQARAKLPIADSVCVQLVGVKEPEQDLVLRKAASFLREKGFRLADADCDLHVVYTALDSGQWEVVTTSLFGMRSKSAYRVEGVVSVSARDGKLLEQDESISLRDYDAKFDVLEALAGAVVGYIPENYRPLNQPPN